jgi:hypothetical protein
VDGEAADLPTEQPDLARVQPGPQLDPATAQIIPQIESTADRAAGRIEGGEEPVPVDLTNRPRQRSTCKRARTS